MQYLKYLKSYTVRVVAIFGIIILMLTESRNDILNITIFLFDLERIQAETYYQFVLSSLIMIKMILTIKGRVDTDKKPNIKDR